MKHFIFLLLLLVTNSLSAAVCSVGSATGLVNVVSAVQTTGTAPFDTDPADPACAVGSILHTEGLDCSDTNRVVRIGQQTVYRVTVTTSTNSDTNITLKLNLTNGTWAAMPVVCTTGSGGVNTASLTCILGTGSALLGSGTGIGSGFIDFTANNATTSRRTQQQTMQTVASSTCHPGTLATNTSGPGIAITQAPNVEISAAPVQVEFMKITESSSATCAAYLGAGSSRGVRSSYSLVNGDSSSFFYEGRYDNGNTIPSGLTHHFGVDYNITKKWAAGFAMEKGDLESRNGLTKTSRRAASTSVSYTEKDIKAGGALEYRTEDSNGITRDTWLGRFKFSSKLGNEWRITSNLDISRSSNSQGNFYNGDWTEGILGFAYRPIQNDKLNMLFRYNYLEVLPSVGQVDRNGGIPNYKQRFNILSIDAIYDLSRIFSLGAKYGFRYGELQDNRLGTGPWYKSDAHLAILRLDMHFIYQWDMIAEYRRLWAMNETQARDGVLLAIYRNLAHKSSLKLGVGYNFADFSDNLSDPNYRYSGWFVNFVGGI